MNRTRFADWVTIWIIHLPDRPQTSRPNHCIGPDCRAMYSCNSWFDSIYIGAGRFGILGVGVSEGGGGGGQGLEY